MGGLVHPKRGNPDPWVGSPPPSRGSRLYRKQRAEFKKRCKARNAECARCHGELGAIDYDAEPQTSSAFELGHRFPLATHPHLFYVESNWQAEHCACNRSAQAEAKKKERNATPASNTSTRWVRPKW